MRGICSTSGYTSHNWAFYSICSVSVIFESRLRRMIRSNVACLCLSMSSAYVPGRECRVDAVLVGSIRPIRDDSVSQNVPTPLLQPRLVGAICDTPILSLYKGTEVSSGIMKP